MPPVAPALPAVFLYPAEEDLSAFAPKLLSLAPAGVRVPIARACKDDAAKQAGRDNGFIDSPVLSRLHAEIWAEGGKIYLKDTKSTHGTYINGERLSFQRLESDPWELITGDIITFGINALEADQLTVKHAKPTVKVFCILTPKDYDQFSVQYPGL